MLHQETYNGTDITTEYNNFKDWKGFKLIHTETWQKKDRYTFVVEQIVNGNDVSSFATAGGEEITAFTYLEAPNPSTGGFFKNHTDRVTLKFLHNESAADYGLSQISSHSYVQRQLDAALI